MATNPNEVYHIYKRYYHEGGAFQVFRGERFQHGSGFGETMQNIGRYVLPIAAVGARSFVKSVNAARKEGRNLKDAVKDAILPTIADTLEKTAETFQSGSGKRGRRSPRRHKGKGRKRRAHKKQQQRRRKAGRVYKKRSTKLFHRRKTRFLKENF